MTDDEPAPKRVVSPEMAEQVLHQGELYLQAQLQLAIAADQRAATMAAFWGAIGTAAAAAAIAYWDRTSDLGILLAGLTCAVFMVAGAAVCLWAARPVTFCIPGNHPEAWFSLLDRPLFDVMLGEAENYQDHIESNATFLESNRRLIGKGAALAVSAPVVAVLVWLVWTFKFSSS